MNYAFLLERAKHGTISARDVDRVAQALQTNQPGADPYILLHIIGRSNALQYRGLVEKRLSDDDPMLVRLALQILCSYWGDSLRYIDQVRAFASGDPRDSENDVRLVALTIAGEHLRETNDSDLARIVLRAFERADEDQNVREAAYRAIGRAVGLDWNEIPASTRHFDLEVEVRPDVVSRFRARFGIEG